MISTRKLLRIARKWQNNAAIGRISHENTNTIACSSSSPVAEKGQFVVYTADQKRYSFPIAYLNIFRELLLMAEEDFGLPSDGPITLPCEAVFMEYLISLTKRGATKDIEKALLISICS
ncbi:hypothetical protein M9H77_18904 [Catharanthus roseus]|uniref:Uncharacterized protein n=1 Tax=Catharanthus roseus TaxID=4058 RepID=A0ACC0B8R6_CATRO|nr:hypothetical protein M9H77_18904 [Catharanthus roseus]